MPWCVPGSSRASEATIAKTFAFSARSEKEGERPLRVSRPPAKGGSSVYKQQYQRPEYLMATFSTVEGDSFSPHENSGKGVKWCCRVGTSSQGLAPRGPGARLGGPPSPGTAALPASLRCSPPGTAMGAGMGFRVWQIAHSGQRWLKLSLNATAREEGEIPGTQRFRGQSACSSRPLPIPGTSTATKGAQGLPVVGAVPWGCYDLGPKAPALTRPADLALLTFLPPDASEGVGEKPPAGAIAESPAALRGGGGSACVPPALAPRALCRTQDCAAWAVSRGAARWH